LPCSKSDSVTIILAESPKIQIGSGGGWVQHTGLYGRVCRVLAVFDACSVPCLLRDDVFLTGHLSASARQGTYWRKDSPFDTSGAEVNPQVIATQVRILSYK